MTIDSILQKILELKISHRKNNNYVFMFHIVDNNYISYNNDHIAISFQSFKDFICKISKKGLKFDKIENLEKNIYSNERFAYLTFDDVWQCSIDNAIKYLEGEGIPYTLFIAERCINKENYIKMQDILRLSQSSLCTIGYHSKNHLFFKNINSHDEDIELDKTFLERKIKKEVFFFAYPYGSIYACGRNKIGKKNVGDYLFAFSTIRSGINSRTFKEMRFFLPRININESNYLMTIKRGIKNEKSETKIF